MQTEIDIIFAMMREIQLSDVLAAVKAGVKQACCRLDPAARACLGAAAGREQNPNARWALETLLDNAEAAERQGMPLCQDTGMAVFFVELGQEVRLVGGSLTDTLDRAVEEAYREGCFRMSVLDPLTRVNTGTNTPAVIHLDLVPGDRLRIRFLPKGFGSENMSKLYMLTPAQGLPVALDRVVEAVREAGSNPCPPVVVGVGFGGTAEKAMEIAKRALLRPLGSPNPDPQLAEIEAELLRRINELGIGAQGFSGKTTALGVHAEKFPTHISAFPVAVNIQCNAVRTAEVIL